MKLVVLPLRTITSKHLFLYGTAVRISPDVKPSVQDRIVKKASETWVSWEAAEKGWKKKVVDLGNKAINTIDFREHSLKSVASENAFARAYGDEAPKRTVSVNYPSALQESVILSQLKSLADEGVPRHKQKLWYSCILMPFTAPFMLVPVVPNLPFFYVAYRAWCHYRAMQGATHLQLLLSQNRLVLTGSKTLDEIYDKEGNMDRSALLRVLKDRNPDMIVEVERATMQLNKLASQAAETAMPVTEKEIEVNKTRARTGLHK